MAALLAFPTLSHTTSGGAMHDTQPHKVLVSSEQDKSLDARHFPDRSIVGTAFTEVAHVSRSRKDIPETRHQALGKVFVEQKLSGHLSRGQDQQSTLTFGRKAETRENVLVRQLREIFDEFSLAAAGGEET